MLIEVMFNNSYYLFIYTFRDKPAESAKLINGTDKVRLSDVFLPASKCTGNFTTITYFYIGVLLIYVVVRLVKLLGVAYSFADIKAFYNVALHIPDVS